MNYSQFLAFTSLLESNKIDFDYWKLNNPELIKEAADDYQPAEAEKKDSDELKTEKGNIITKKGRMRSSLNKQAKKLQEGIMKEVGGKLLKPIADMKIQVYKKMAEVGKGKQPKEIVAALKADLQGIQKLQTKQMGAIEKHIQNSIDNTTKKIHAVMEKKGLKEETLADLQTYWSLLTTQIFNNILQKIAVNDDKVIGEVIKDQDILKAAKQINAALNKPQKKKEAELKAEIEKLKGEIKKRDEATAPAEQESPAETKNAEEKK